MQPIVLILPARDEAATVANVIGRVPAAIRSHPVEVLVVDDGSTDATGALARACGAVVLRHEISRGLGAAIRIGLQAATARDPAAVAFCDADGEYAPEELERIVAPILDYEADYVVGSRFSGRIDRMLPHRRLANRCLTMLVRAWLRVPITDAQSGYRALSARAAREVEIPHDYNYAQVLTVDLMHRGFRYDEVPISYAFRQSGTSFVRPLQYLHQVGLALWRQHQSWRVAQSSTTWRANPARARAQRAVSN